MEEESVDSPGTPGTPLEGSSREGSADLQEQYRDENDPDNGAAEPLSDEDVSPVLPGDSKDANTEREADYDDTEAYEVRALCPRPLNTCILATELRFQGGLGTRLLTGLLNYF